MVELDPFTVVSTGTGSERLARESPVRTQLLRPELFQSSGARDLAAALEYLPGIRAEANCQNCGTAEIKMLGLGSGYNQLLFDGQPLFSGLASVYGIEQIPTAFIGRIEVVKGGASTLYGPGAVAGVINVLPKIPTENGQRIDWQGESVSGASVVSASFVKDWASQNGDAAASAFGQTNNAEAVDLNDDGFSDVTEKAFRTMGVNAWMYPTQTGRLSFNYAYSWEKRRGGDRFDLEPHEAQIAEQLEHHWQRGGIAWESNFETGFSYRLSAALSSVERDSYYGGVGATALPDQAAYSPEAYAAALERSRLLYGYSTSERMFYDARFSHRSGPHELSWGSQYQIDNVFDEKRSDAGRPLRSDGTQAASAGDDPIVDGAFSDLGFFLQDEWAIGASTSLVVGARADKHSEIADWIFSPRAAARHASSPEWTWRVGVATGFRAPELFDEDFHIEILEDPTRTRNEPGLVAERAVSVSADFVWTPWPETKRFQLEGAVFRTQLRDSFSVSDIVHHDADGTPYKERRNAGDAVAQGAEINARTQLTERWSGEFGAAYLDSRYSEPQEVLEGVFERRFIESPAWSGIAQLKYENDAWLDLFCGIVYTGPMIALRAAEGTINPVTPAFWVVNLTASKHFHWGPEGAETHIDAMIGVKNLLDARQPDLGAGPERDTTYLYGPRFPRSVVISLAARW